MMRAGAQALSFPAVTVSAIPYQGAGVLMGWSVVETTGTAAGSLEVFDGMDATGQSVAVITLSPGQSTRDWFGVAGIELERGCFVKVLTGSVRGAVWVIPTRVGAREAG